MKPSEPIDPPENEDAVSSSSMEEVEVLSVHSDQDFGSEPEEIMDDLEELENGENDDDEEQEPVEDMAAITWTFESPVFGCALHPKEPVAVVGSQDDYATVYDYDSNEVIHRIDHNDTITHVEFNFNGRYLMTADMSGVLIISKVIKSGSETDDNDEENCGDIGSSANIKTPSSDNTDPNNVKPKYSIVTYKKFEMGNLSWAMWHTIGNVIFAGGESGEVFVWRLNTEECKVLPAISPECHTGDLSCDGKKLIAGYSNSVIALWDIKSQRKIFEISEDVETDIRKVKAHSKLPVYAAICGNTLLMLSERGLSDKTKISDQQEESIETLSMSPSEDIKLLAIGTLSGRVQIWDYANMNLRHDISNISNDSYPGITSMIWLNDFLLCCGDMRGRIVIRDARDGVEKLLLTGHTSTIYEIKYNAEQKTLLTTSEDHKAKIFRLEGQLADL